MYILYMYFYVYILKKPTPFRQGRPKLRQTEGSQSFLTLCFILLFTATTIWAAGQCVQSFLWLISAHNQLSNYSVNEQVLGAGCPFNRVIRNVLAVGIYQLQFVSCIIFFLHKTCQGGGLQGMEELCIFWKYQKINRGGVFLNVRSLQNAQLNAHFQQVSAYNSGTPCQITSAFAECGSQPKGFQTVMTSFQISDLGITVGFMVKGKYLLICEQLLFSRLSDGYSSLIQSVIK